MNSITKFIIIFLALTGASTLLMQFTSFQFGNVDFFEKHGIFFLFAIALFPRITLFVSGVILGSIHTGGFLWWAGFFIAPRILVAILATISYWQTNPILVLMAWPLALSFESSEKFLIRKRMKSAPQKFNSFSGDTIEAEFKVKE